MFVSWAHCLHSFDLFGLEVVEICGICWLCLSFEPIVYVLSIWLALFVVRRVTVFVVQKGPEVFLQFDLILPFLEGWHRVNFIHWHYGICSRFVNPLLYKFIILLRARRIHLSDQINQSILVLKPSLFGLQKSILLPLVVWISHYFFRHTSALLSFLAVLELAGCEVDGCGGQFVLQ